VPLIFGISRAQFDLEENNPLEMTHLFNQLGLRDRLPLNTLHLRYHPDIGYL
jgi:hypothetical protein